MIMYLLIGSIFPKTDFSQIKSIFKAVEHYKEHKVSEDGTMSIWNFVKSHFLHLEDHESEDNHEDLPFHQITSGADFLIQQIICSWNPSIQIDPSNCIESIADLTSMDFYSKVYRPPSA